MASSLTTNQLYPQLKRKAYFCLCWTVSHFCIFRSTVQAFHACDIYIYIYGSAICVTYSLRILRTSRVNINGVKGNRKNSLNSTTLLTSFDYFICSYFQRDSPNTGALRLSTCVQESSFAGKITDRVNFFTIRFIYFLTNNVTGNLPVHPPIYPSTVADKHS